MICAGCGLELPPKTGRGRPARFHNGACRQRAHRAKASQPIAVLAALDAVETAAREIRWAVLTSSPTRQAAHQLADAMRELTEHLREQTPIRRASDTAITHSATTPVDAPPSTLTNSSEHVNQLPAPPPRQAVTKNVTKIKGGSATSRSRRRTSASAALDLDTVRLEPSADPGTWRVLAGETGDSILVGTLTPALSFGRRRKWEARDQGWITVPGGPWPTRQAALIHLLDSHQRRAGA